jgi:glycosyltransferase involved in cell wall biosynthesis
VSQAAKELRVLVIFGNIPLLGQERGNIRVFETLKTQGVDALFVTHAEYGHELIQPELDRLGLHWVTAPYCSRFVRGMGIGRWLRNLWTVLTASWQFWRLARRYGPTHIHVANPLYFINFLPALCLVRTPVIYRCGDTPAVHDWLHRLLWTQVISRRVSHFVAISQYVKGTLRRIGVTSDKISVIYNSPPSRRVLGESPPVQRREGLTTILYVGQLSREKGLDLLIECALELCRARVQVRLLIAGDYSFQNPFARGLIEKVSKAGLDEQIHFLGFVNSPAALYEISDIHVFPSVWEEPLGNVAMEAKQAGIPSVVFSSGGIPETIEHLVDGYICEHKTAAALTRGLLHFIEDEARCLEAGRRAKDSLVRLGVPEFSDKWKDVYEAV